MTRVVSIVGCGRSGSTLLSSILAELPGVLGAGEVRWLWGRDLVEQRVCTCGRRPAACPVWSSVVHDVLGLAPDEQTPERLRERLRGVVAAQRRAQQWPRRWRVLTAPARGGGDQTAEVDATVETLRALARLTGAHTVVDSSKRPQEAAVIASSGAFDHYVVHVVRDPRAVVHSWRRAKALPAVTGRTAMATRTGAKTVWRWLDNASSAEVLRRSVPADRWLSLRYEDVAADPRAALQQVLDLIGLDGALPFEGPDTVVLHPGHVLSGNPNRFQEGPVRVRVDREWAETMPRREQAAIAAATWPFLRRYGYARASAS